MKTRDKTYKDYGFADGEAKKLKEYCRSERFTPTDKAMLWQAAEMSYPSIAKYLYDSIRKKISYERLTDMYYVPINMNDFYGYQRLCLNHYRCLKNNANKGV